ncbi:MAG: ZIP family metal transporter [Patescibacteria group bacterium]
MPILYWIIGASILSSVVSLAGRSIAFLGEEKFRRFIQYAISLAVGVLLGVVFLDVLPEALEMSEDPRGVLLWVLGGFLFFFILERLLLVYHCHEGQCPVHVFGYLSLLGDAVHNFIDGVIIALAFFVDIKIGVLTAVAVVLHEIPQEMSDFLVLLHAGFSRARAMFYNFLIALTAVLGAILTYVFLGAIEGLIAPALAVVAGNFLYIAAVDLVPELHEAEHGRKKTAVLAQFLLIFLGIAIIWASGFILER